MAGYCNAVCDTVGTATNFYTKGLQDTTNERDNVCSVIVFDRTGRHNWQHSQRLLAHVIRHFKKTK